ncbi:sortilin [Hoplias malabaricus]|uniref:sortilin n=1 Tax=Hoplias malabaricus TaxID=27720 RepID=UPI00346238A6
MVWTLAVSALACLVVFSEAVSFSRPLPGERLANTRRRRDSWAVKSNFVACKSALSPKEHKILNRNQYETGFRGDDGFTFSLTWVGDGTGIILVLSTVSAPLESLYEGGTSRLYRSDDYGKSFLDISHAINNSFIKKDFGICVSPGNSHQVILISELPITHSPGGAIFTSVDSGVTFKSVQLPFHPAQSITFHDQNQEWLLVIGTDSGLWLSQDFGNSWSKIHDGVYSFILGPDNTLFFSYSPENTVEADKRGELFLRRTQDLGQTFSTIAQNIFTFGYIGRFLFTSVLEKEGSPRVIYVSSDNGDHFSKALLPTASSEQFYSLLDGDEDMIFIHVDSPGESSYFGTIYTSDDRGILYSKSLERHLFGMERKSDFTNVTSMRGVYLTNVLEEDDRISTVITFNKGGEWGPLKKPENVECGKSVEKCNLHIHGEHSLYSGISPMLPLSDSSAIGLIIAHGSVGDSISASKPDVYVSSDGGYNWIGTLRGPHYYSILDSGSLIVAAEAHKDRTVNSIKISTDEGQCWKIYNFTDQPFFIAGLASEPGSKTMNISVFGYRPDGDDQPMWVAVTIDFEHLLTRECGEDDYVEWLAHSDDERLSETKGCVLGYKETFRRLKKSSVCKNGRSYVVNKQQSPCLCTREDYMCDYGYYHHENSSECVEESDFTDKKLKVCLNEEIEELHTTGYRKIPSDKCEGGFRPPRRMDASKEYCGNSSDIPSSRHHIKKLDEVWLRIVISVSVGTVVLSIITAIAITVRRTNHRQRSTAYRFSALQRHEEEPCIGPESGPSSNQDSFQEDSDDDLID